MVKKIKFTGKIGKIGKIGKKMVKNKTVNKYWLL
jgi:hypothetical protein